MRTITIAGIVLVIAGVLALVLPHIPITTEETVLQIGPVEATAERDRFIAIHPAIGIGLLVLGAVLLVVDRLKR
jgi:drug/metabolite transporter (DMT)-like permease